MEKIWGNIMSRKDCGHTSAYNRIKDAVLKQNTINQSQIFCSQCQKFLPPEKVREIVSRVQHEIEEEQKRMRERFAK